MTGRSSFSTSTSWTTAASSRHRSTSRLWKEDDDWVAEVYGAVAIANTIAFISEAIDPISIFISLTRRGLMGQAIRYLLFGEGETGLMVYAILLRYWEWTPEEDVRPLIFLMSD